MLLVVTRGRLLATAGAVVPVLTRLPPLELNDTPTVDALRGPE